MIADVREATKEDYAAILPIAGENQELHVEALPHIFRKGVAGLPEDYFLGLLASNSSRVYVAVFEDSIIGYAIVEFKHEFYLDILIPQEVAFINDIAVLKAHQGKGVGYALFQSCARWAKTKGATSLELMVWEFNKNAIAFYEHRGMVTMNRTMSLRLT